jgi:hypothetical protein
LEYLAAGHVLVGEAHPSVGVIFSRNYQGTQLATAMNSRSPSSRHSSNVKEEDSPLSQSTFTSN